MDETPVREYIPGGGVGGMGNPLQDYLKNFTALLETSFEQNNHLFFMSHTKKAFLTNGTKTPFAT